MARTKRADFADPVVPVAETPTPEVAPEVLQLTVVLGGIAPLDLDLGRQDLNSMVGKINEIIAKVNE